MLRWVSALSEVIRRDKAAVLVTVIVTRGSAPRASGARMVVSERASLGSIGGGQLEFRAQGIARAMLQNGADDDGSGTRIMRFPLGASLGQCCGGVVELGFERVGTDDLAWLDQAGALDREGGTWARIRRLGVFSSQPPTILTATAAASLSPAALGEVAQEAARLLLAEAEGGLSVVADDTPASAPWLIDVTAPPALTVVLFGAGHVGCAIAEVFGRLPFRVIWVDGRDACFPDTVASNIETRVSDDPTDEVKLAPKNAFFLVMTHSHALDFDLIRAILDRGEFGYLGLIGSTSKRKSFAARLRARGYPDADIARVHCPIGVPGVVGKEPEVIAVSVAASLLRMREPRATRTVATGRIECAVSGSDDRPGNDGERRRERSSVREGERMPAADAAGQGGDEEGRMQAERADSTAKGLV